MNKSTFSQKRNNPKYGITSDEMIGKKFNRLTVLERKYDPKHRRTKFICRCECGSKAIVDRQKILSGHTRSCGCLQKERAAEAKFIHGASLSDGSQEHRLYKLWSAMRERCRCPNNQAYKNYGGRKIKVCKEWGDYLTFRKWALNNGYKPGLTLDRINNNGDYEPTNCRWTTRRVQNLNRRNTLYLTYKGKTLPMTAWAEKTDIDYKCLYSRITKLGWSVERALTEPPRARKKGEKNDNNK